MIYVIYKLWVDPSEKPPLDAGYNLLGYVNTEVEAKRIVNSGGRMQCLYPPWCNDVHNYKYEELYEYGVDEV